MLGRPGDDRPFVLVDEIVKPPGAFVQFVGSKSQPLLIDCPPLKVYATRCTFENAIDEALAALRAQGLTDETALIIVEQTQPEGGSGGFPERVPGLQPA